MEAEIHTLEENEWHNQKCFQRLKEIPQPPKTLYYQGELPEINTTLLAIVGSRKYTTYGRQVVETFVEDLAEYNIGIVSGLARGIDSLAHEAALKAKLYTLAIPGSGLAKEVLYPTQNRGLADQIIANKGGLLSELHPNTKAARWTFPQRNRLMAGITHATLIIEAEEKSGTLITASLAVDYNRELLVVPGNVFSPQSMGTHQFLKLGATPVTSGHDIATALNLARKDTNSEPSRPAYSQTEQIILETLRQPADIDHILHTTGLSAQTVSTTLMELEINGSVLVANGLYQRKV